MAKKVWFTLTEQVLYEIELEVPDDFDIADADLLLEAASLPSAKKDEIEYEYTFGQVGSKSADGEYEFIDGLIA